MHFKNTLITNLKTKQTKIFKYMDIYIHFTH